MNARSSPVNGLSLAGSAASRAIQDAPGIDTKLQKQLEATRLAYWGVLLFVLIYCLRPNDWLPAAFVDVRFAMMAAVVALAGMLFALLRLGLASISREMQLLFLLFIHLVATIPFSIWSGGSFEVVIDGFSKVVLIAVCTALALTHVKRLRNVLLVQTAVVSGMAILSAAGMGYSFVDPAGQMRIVGMVGGIFENPNDYAFALSLVFPVAFYFLLQSRFLLVKLAWGMALLAIAYSVTQTLSRGGLLALAAAFIFVLWEFGIKGRRRYLIPLAALATVGVVAAAPGEFSARVQSIFNPSLDATGSRWARRELLMNALDIAARSPVFGVGPGNYTVVSGVWKGVHNTYLQLGAEAGFPAMFIYLGIMGYSFRNLRRIQHMTRDPEVRDMASALFAALACYAVGAFFGDTAYHFFPYLLFGYVSALYVYVTAQGHPALQAEHANVSGAAQPSPSKTSGNPFLEGWRQQKGSARLISSRDTHVRNRGNR